ncbi:MAG: AMP-binding protein [Sphingomonadales bacterium]|nr:AMP-binding protein [Sphingomonadales bacterium]
MEWTQRTQPNGWQTRWSDGWAARWKAEGHWTDRTLPEIARETLARDPDKTYQIEGERRMTRAQVWDQSLRLAGFFLDRGLVRGDVISLQLPNWCEAAVIGLAARMCGLVINPIPPIYRGAELAFILADCGAKLIFVPGTFRKHDYVATVQGLRGELPALRDVVVVRDAGDLTWDEAIAGPPVDESRLPALDAGDVIIAMYTSGTTGRPKCVLHTQHTYGHRVQAMADSYPIGEDDVAFMPSPVTHITGAIWAFDMPWVAGNVSVLMDVWTPEEGVAAIEQHGCTVTGGATPFLQQMLDVAESAPQRLRSLKLFFCGGTTVSPELIRRASDMLPQAKFFRAYGSTECLTATLGYEREADKHLGAETDGEVRHPVQMRIVDGGTGAELPAGAEGEIYLLSPGLCVGYLAAEDNTGNFEPDGFFKMGDLGRRVNGSFLVITGRSKDIIIRSGENISPKEVEDVLYGHPAVAEVAIVAMPSAVTGEKGCAFIIPRAGQSIDLPEIRRFLDAAGLARQKFPEHVVLVDDLPRVPSGKVRKDVLREDAKRIAASEG